MAKLKEFNGTYRISFKQKTTIGDVYYTVEYSEGYDDIKPEDDINELKQKMWDSVNEQVKIKCNEILNQ